MAMQTAKKALRSEMKKRLAALPKSEILDQSQYLTEEFVKLPEFIKSQRIAVYLSMPDEVQTDGILTHIFQLGKTCFIPRYDSSSCHMDMFRLHSLQDMTSLAVTRWNVRQPADNDSSRENPLLTGGLDLILVPGLAFTKDGRRLGRGKGYYDNYLERCAKQQQSPPCTIALALSPQIVSEIPTLPHDFIIDKVLTRE